jgi:two-component system, NtrC family, sensor kinase
MENRPWKILLVEDDKDDYYLTKALLKDAKGVQFDLIWASTYDSSLSYLDRDDLDVILVDYLLDAHNGLDLVREAIARGCRAPIIVFTGQDSYEVDMEAMKIGAVDYLVKGEISAALLERTIRYAIEQKQSEEALQRAHDQLEQRVQERTKELAQLNEDLRAEIRERKKIEEALVASEVKFRTLAESTSTAIFIIQDLHIRYANNAARFITGYTSQELICMEFWQLAHPTYQNIIRQYGVANKRNDEEIMPVSTRYEMKLLTKKGDERWVDVTAGPIEFEGKMAWVVTIFDITERDLAEKELRKHKEELEVRVIERTAELRESNQRLQVELVERKKAEKALRQARDELEQRVRERTRELAVTNEELRAEIAERKRAEELLQLQADRSEALAEISSLLVEAGPDYQSMLELISRSIATQIGDACIIFMVSEKTDDLEPVASFHSDPEILDSIRQSLPLLQNKIKKRLVDQIYSTDQPLLIPETTQEWQNVLNEEQFLPYFEKHTVSSVAVVPINIQGKIIGSLALFREKPGHPFAQEDLVMLKSLASRIALAIANINLYKDLEDALQKEQAMRRQLVQAEKHSAISRMVASVAHELNNPIQTIQNCLFLTNQDISSDSPIHEYLDMALSETQRVSKLVNQLREIYRPSQSTPLQYTEVFKLLAEVHTLLLPHLQHQQVHWQANYEESEMYIAAIADQIKQVFINISLNAIEAMQPNGGELCVSIEYSPSFDMIGVAFKDTGPGIKIENLSKVFEPFFTTKDSGTGLGLSICYDIVQRHGGEITIDSSHEKGTTFKVWLPLLQDNMKGIVQS